MFLLGRTKNNQKSIFVFSSSIPLSASSLGFVAGEFHEQAKSHDNEIVAAIDRTHHYMVNYGRHMLVS